MRPKQRVVSGARIYDYRNPSDAHSTDGVGARRKRTCDVCGRVTISHRPEECLRCRNRLRIANGLAPMEQPIESFRVERMELYGLTLEDFLLLAKQQGGRCAICRAHPEVLDDLVVDHNHQTGEVRGLLCGSCNTGLGHLKDSPDVLRNAVSYLESLGYYGPDLEAGV